MHVRVGVRRLYVSVHALERYQERVMPALDAGASAEHLARVIVHAEFGPRPGWLAHLDRVDMAVVADEWLLLGDGIAFPVVDGRVMTCYTPGLGEMGREHRSRVARKQQLRPAKHFGAVRRAERRRRRDAKGALE